MLARHLQARVEDTPGGCSPDSCGVDHWGVGPRRIVWGLLAQSWHPGPSAQGACEAAAGQTEATRAGRALLAHDSLQTLGASSALGSVLLVGCTPRAPAGSHVSFRQVSFWRMSSCQLFSRFAFIPLGQAPGGEVSVGTVHGPSSPPPRLSGVQPGSPRQDLDSSEAEIPSIDAISTQGAGHQPPRAV